MTDSGATTPQIKDDGLVANAFLDDMNAASHVVKLERRRDRARTGNHGSLLGAQEHRGEPGGRDVAVRTGAGARAGSGSASGKRKREREAEARAGTGGAGAGEMGVSARTDDVGERWGLGARRDIRRVRRWRGHDGRDATGAIAGAWRERCRRGLPGGERLESRVGYWGGLRRVGRAD